ncbi:hypothetical protein EJ03DRAFT_282244, partial [Teratosphaeria nubilosa]
FLHTPLDPSKREIRLLVMRSPHGWRRYLSEHIHCTLSVHSLGSAPSYTALSYVWGNPKKRKRIYVNGRRAYITQNLFEALEQLYDLEYRDQVFLVNALCINQDDLEERKNQVKFMADIYRRATLGWTLVPGMWWRCKTCLTR